KVEIPIDRMNSAKEVGQVPIRHASLGPILKGERTQSNGGMMLLQDVAQIEEGVMPGEYDRYNMRRLVSMTANIQGEDLGRVAARVRQAIRAAGEVPRGTEVDVRGQVVPMEQMFWGLAVGLALAAVVIFLLLTAFCQ